MTGRSSPSRSISGMTSIYLRRSTLRCDLDIRRRLDIICSISQNIQTRAAPRPTTTIKNINVNSGAVVMLVIPLIRHGRRSSNELAGLLEQLRRLFRPAVILVAKARHF